MKRLRNGSLLSNLLLVTGGALAGSTLTWSLALYRGPSISISDAAVSATENRKSPARTSALHTRAGDHSLKLSQIIAADNPEHKADDLNRLGREIASDNPSAALELAGSVASETDRLAFVRGAFEGWAAKDPRSAATYAEANFPSGEVRSEALRVSIASWGETDPRAAFQWMEENLAGPLKEEALAALAQGWSRRAPQQAADWFVETGSTSQPLLSAIAGTWAQHDPAAAVRWAAGLTEAANRDVGLASALGEMARHDPAAAALAAAPFLQLDSAASPLGSAVTNLATVLSDIWGSQNPASAAEWVQKLPAGPSQQEAAGTLATVWASSDITAAVAWSATLADPSLKASVVAHLGTTWGAIEPDRALTWLDTLPADIAARGVKGALNSWAATDPVGLEDWIGQMPPGARSDLARRSLGDVVSGEQPLAALELAAGMSDPNQQSDAFARYYRQFHRADPASATEWLQSEWGGLPAPAQLTLAREQQRLLQSARRTSP